MRHNNICSRKTEQGIALVSTLLFLAILGLLATALVFTVQNEMKTSTAYRYTEQAFYVADAGIQKSVNWFRNSYQPLIDSSLDGTAYNKGAENYDATESPVEYNSMPVMLAGQTGDTSVFPNDGSSYTGAFASAFSNITLDANNTNSGVYEVNATLLKYTPAIFVDPTTFISYPSAKERWRIDSVGYWGDPNNPMGISHIEAIIENNGNALFDKALWGIDHVYLGGTLLVDSYDPSQGNYNSVDNAGEEGSVGSNGSVTATGTVDIYGDLAWGPEGSYTGLPNINVTGSRMQMAEEREFPPIPDWSFNPMMPPSDVSTSGDMTITPGDYGTVSISNGDILTLEPGVYYFDTLDEFPTGTLAITGATTLFVKNGLDLAGQGVINPLGDPTELTIYYSGTTEAGFVGGSSAYMEVYAPEAPVKLSGDSDFFGSFIGKTLTMTGTPRVHFSLGCLDDNLVERPFRVLSWAQKNF